MTEQIFIVKLSERPRKILGPFDFSRVQSELSTGYVQWTDIAWCPSWNTPWRRLFEVSQFKPLMSEFPTPEKLEKYKTLCEQTMAEIANSENDKTEVSHSASIKDFLNIAPKPAPNDYHKETPSVAIHSPDEVSLRVPAPVAPIYLQIKGSEHGPITVQELKSTLASGKFKDQVYVWYRGLETWFPAQEIPGFENVHFTGEDGTKSVRKGASLLGVIHGRDGRIGIRHRFAATAHLISTAGKRVPMGVCADVSNTGMQIWLENNLQFKKDDVIQLELVPLSLTGLPSMPVKAKVMWFNDKELRVGIYFLNFNGDGWDRLKGYLSKLESQVATKHMNKA